MPRLLISLVAGLIFGIGLALSGMSNPLKVLGFLDLAGDWDPSLLFVLGGAVGVTVIAFRLILRRTAPVLEENFHLPSTTAIDRPLLIGALLFGIGWGIAGYCPGPAIALLAAPGPEALIFLPALMLGSYLQRRKAARSALTETGQTLTRRFVPTRDGAPNSRR
jgi:uncharacterized membrane protein YedE/YeeE